MGMIRDNPIFWREGVPRAIRRATPNMRCALLVGLTLMSGLGAILLATRRWRSSEDLGMMIAWLWAGVTLLIVPSHTSRAIVQERLRGTWDALAVTRLKPWEIFGGKLLSVLVPVWLVGLFLLPTCLLMVASSPYPQDRDPALVFLAWAYGSGSIGSLGFGALGLFVSKKCSSIWSAQLWTFVPMVVLIGGSFSVFVAIFS